VGTEHPITDLARINWALALFESGDTESALAMLAPVHARMLARLGAASPQTQPADRLQTMAAAALR